MAKRRTRDVSMIPPRHLSHYMRGWMSSIVDRYQIEPQHFEILVKCAEAWDRTEAARKVIAKRGLTYLDRFQAPRLRPEVAVERDSRLAFVRCLRELALENETPEEKPARVAPSISKRGGQV